MNDLQNFLTMLSKSKVDFSKKTGPDGITVISRGVEFNFFKDGTFNFFYINQNPQL